MSRQKIEFDFLVNGVESAAQKLKGIEALNQSLAKGISSADLFKATGGNFSASTLAKNKDLFAQMGKDAGKAFDQGLKSSNSALGAFINQSMGIGAGQNRPNRAGYAAFWQRAIPPQLAPPIIGGSGGGGFGLSNLLGGLGAGGGGLVGKILPVIDVLQALKMASEYLKKAFDQLVEAVQRGSKLFLDSAKLGRESGGLFQLRSALSSAGLSSGQVDSLLLNAEFAKSQQHGPSSTSGRAVQGTRGLGSSINGNYLNGLGTGQYAESQQIRNMMAYVNAEWRDAAIDSRLAANNAKGLFVIGNEFNKLKREWNTLWEELAADLGTYLIPVIQDIKNKLKAVNFAISISELGLFKKIIDKIYPDSGKEKLGAFGNQLIPANSFQKMGFVFGNGGYHGDAVQETARNTKATALAVRELVQMAKRDASEKFNNAWSATNP